MKAWPASLPGPKAPSATSNTPAAGFTVSAAPPPLPDRTHAAQQVLYPLGHILKCSARSTRQIRRRPAAPQATRDRIRANADNWKASRRSLYSNAQVSNRSQRRVAGNAQGEDEAAVLLIDMYRTPVSGVLRRKESGFA